MEKIFKFSKASTHFYFDSSIKKLSTIVDKKQCIIITDENVFKAHGKLLNGFRNIVLPPGEEYKNQLVADSIIQELIRMEVDRKTVLIGIGGGVITDITGYVASVYMRGLKFGFVPTSILGIVDASIGGKNGIDVGVYKNMVGTINQPAFILHDLSLLQTLPKEQWINGFAEVIKHAFIKDAKMFKELQINSIEHYMKDKKALADLIQRNALIKINVVRKDEFEKGDRKLLNFGHTLGHAIETQYELLHGHAIAIGMVYAAQLSALYGSFKEQDAVVSVFEKYGLPTNRAVDAQKVFEVLKMDKKRNNKEMNFVLLSAIGKAYIQAIPLTQLQKNIKQFQA